MTSLSPSSSYSLRSVLNRRATPYFLAIGLAASAIAYALYAGSDQLEKARLLARYTARAAFLIFIITYSASALARLWPNPITLSVMRNRFHWGMGFCFAMIIHIVAFSPFLFMANNGEKGQAIYIGAFGLAIIFVMALTPLKAAARAGNLRWTKRLHRVGMYVTWAQCLLIYQFHVTHPAWGLSNIPLLLLCVIAVGLRLAAWIKTQLKKYQQTTVTANLGI